MHTDTDADLQSTGTEEADLDPRDVRALTQYLTVLDDDPRVAGADDLYLVVSESGAEYLVDVREDSCECDDYRYRADELGERGCKHRRRVAFATGERAIPQSVDPAKIDRQLGNHVDGKPRVATADGGSDGASDAGSDAERASGGASGGANDADRRDRDAADERPADVLPSDAYRLGVDREGRDHWHGPLSDHVWVFRDDEVVYDRSLDGRSVVEWVEFVADEHGGWADRQPVEREGGVGGAVADVLERMEAR